MMIDSAALPSCHVFIAASLDGFIARKDGDIDWLIKHSGGSEDHGYDTFMTNIDGIVMGRGTFDKVLSFPEWIYKKPVIVLSQSRETKDVPAALAGKVRVSKAAPRALLAELARDGWRRVYVDGGQVIQSFLKEGLIDDFILTHIPVLLGEGIPLFGSLGRDVDLTHVGTKTFPSGLVQSQYRVQRT